MYKMIDGIVVDETQEEINQRLAREMEVKEEYPRITEQEETIALLVLENENLKQRITILEGGTV